MTEWITVGELSVDPVLHRFVEEEALPGSGVESGVFWSGLDAIVHDLSPRLRRLLAKRTEIQAALDHFHTENPGAPADVDAYRAFLTEIGYLVEEPADVTVTASRVDAEVSTQAGPQLVVPLLNARFALNAANARWGSLYDAFYGTDVIDRDGDWAPGSSYNQSRGAEVVRRVRDVLDAHFPLDAATHHDVDAYAVDVDGLIVTIGDATVRLSNPVQFVGYRGDGRSPEAVLLEHHGLHVEIQIDRAHAIGSVDRAGVKDVVLEAALTSIMDLEDSVAAVDVEEKVHGYRNWLQLMQGTLSEKVDKDGRRFVRTLNPDREYTARDGSAFSVPGRALMFIRQVGHLMTTHAVHDRDGQPVSEGLLDALLTALGSTHDLRGIGAQRNSRTGSIYAVRPKMHGPEEVSLTVELFERVERILGLEHGTVKVGIMDEERRTSVNLKACIAAAADRIAFINTGFLDRTGDEIHTSMHAGPMLRKTAMKTAQWLTAYENSNVDIGLECGLRGKAQIGKGMWAAPDNLADLLEQKVTHPQAGANCAWVPSPTAATLHALHYHQVDVQERQNQLTGRRRSTLEELLTIPLADPTEWTDQDVQAELDNNVQSTLGYVVRWVDDGVGCSKVPDRTGTPLMEDRATCRISSQHVANWLLHGVISIEDVEVSLRRMATVVDDQNSDNPGYRPMAPGFDGEAFLAARELLLEGARQPSGYTEPILHRRRTAQKQAAGNMA
ncbi:malate synthase G [Mycobacterium sp. NPDC003323]